MEQEVGASPRLGAYAQSGREKPDVLVDCYDNCFDKSFYCFQIGGLFQANWAKFDGKLYAEHWAASDFVEIDMAEIQIAVGMNCMLSDQVSVYGGPFFHFIDGELYDTFSEVDAETGGLLTSEYLWNIEQDSVFGGYLGAQMELAENCFLNIEFQHTTAADAFGASIAWRF